MTRRMPDVVEEVARLRAELDDLRGTALARATPGAWVELTLVNGWAAQSGRTPMVRLVGDRVEFKGQLNGSAASSTTICTLPVGFRPLDRTVVLTSSSGTSGSATVTRVQIAASGVMTSIDAAAPGVGPALEGLSFPRT